MDTYTPAAAVEYLERAAEAMEDANYHTEAAYVCDDLIPAIGGFTEAMIVFIPNYDGCGSEMIRVIPGLTASRSDTIAESQRHPWPRIEAAGRRIGLGASALGDLRKELER